ncbi:uncharacterized protein LOC127882105 [Dreissena polymorpha]|uniref:Uncharacterized protein n=1 Tax=Dreissena polymorpha TaxID=45954 RepID=A0A9D4JT39_DREPO|nr:uncharacterized protein LOC127882105 [Dreissena polymorpha]KAH3823221.1 hypothetical protein DPMN_125020 [Dreissena polymorpha]
MASAKTVEVSTGYTGYTKIVLLIMRSAMRVMKRLLLRFISALKLDLTSFLDKYKADILDTEVGEKYRHVLYPMRGPDTTITKWDMSVLTCILAEAFRRILILHVKRLNATFDGFLRRHRTSILSSPTGRAYMLILFPKSGRASEVKFWNMSLLATVLSKACNDPLHIPSHLFRDIGYICRLRKELYHSTEPLLTHDDYVRYLASIKGFIERALVYLGSKAFKQRALQEVAEIEKGIFYDTGNERKGGIPKDIAESTSIVTERIDVIDKKIDYLYRMVQRLEGSSQLSEPTVGGNETFFSTEDHYTSRSEGNPLPSRLNHIRESLREAQRDLHAAGHLRRLSGVDEDAVSRVPRYSEPGGLDDTHDEHVWHNTSSARQRVGSPDVMSLPVVAQYVHSTPRRVPRQSTPYVGLQEDMHNSGIQPANRKFNASKMRRKRLG